MQRPCPCPMPLVVLVAPSRHACGMHPPTPSVPAAQARASTSSSPQLRSYMKVDEIDSKSVLGFGMRNLIDGYVSAVTREAVRVPQSGGGGGGLFAQFEGQTSREGTGNDEGPPDHTAHPQQQPPQGRPGPHQPTQCHPHPAQCAPAQGLPASLRLIGPTGGLPTPRGSDGAPEASAGTVSAHRASGT